MNMPDFWFNAEVTIYLNEMDTQTLIFSLEFWVLTKMKKLKRQLFWNLADTRHRGLGFDGMSSCKVGLW